jgi:MurNAc alpha-1-phosphate uridylyltransferase
VTDRVTSRYFLFDEGGKLCGWRNATTGQERMVDGGPHGIAARLGEAGRPGTMGGPLTQKAFSGIHVIDPAIFPLMTRDGKFSVVDLYLDLAADHPIRAHDHSHSRLIDVGKPESVLQAEALFPS